jgi:hypothetical protein
MQKCTQCGFINVDDAFICARCYALILFDARNRTEPFDATPLADELPPAVPPNHRDEFKDDRLPRGYVALYIGELDIPAVIRIHEAAYLGRESIDLQPQPFLDLGPFDGQSLGVSRLHAALRRTPDGIYLEDLNSSNGTWVNRHRLVPEVLHPLQSGDRLRLSRLIIDIYIGEGQAVKRGDGNKDPETPIPPERALINVTLVPPSSQAALAENSSASAESEATAHRVAQALSERSSQTGEPKQVPPEP